MNPDTPQTPREEIEVRLTALLMGELAPDETAALQSLIAADPALAALHSRLARAVELLREASALPEHPTPPVPAQLSAEKRERLLAQFKTPAPASSPMIVKPKWNWKPYVPLSLAAALIGIIGVSTIQFLGFRQVLLSSGIADPRSLAPPQPLSWFLPKRDQENEPARLVLERSAVSLAESRSDSPTVPAATSPRGYVAGGGGGADTNGNATHWMFNKPAEPETPTNGRTAFWNDDEASKLKVNTASEGTFWDESTRQSGLAREMKPAPAAESAPAAEPLAANTTPLAAARGGEAEVLRRSVRFAEPQASCASTSHRDSSGAFVSTSTNSSGPTRRSYQRWPRSAGKRAW